MALLPRQQSFQQKEEEGGKRAPTFSTKAPVTLGEGGRRASSILGLTGPKTASLSAPASASAPGPGPTPAPGSTPGPTLFGLLASKRLAKRFASRFQRRRQGTLSSLVSSSGAVPTVLTEPTYRMEPRRKFHSYQVERMLKQVVDGRMDKFRYSPRLCANMCKILGDDIKEQVKQMNFDRYKIVSSVVIGQKKDQAVMMCSRCAWDDRLDNFASYTFQNEQLFCTATVFGIYRE